MAAESTDPRVLLIYPAGPTRRGMEDALGDAGVVCDRADNVLQAVSRFAAEPADLVVLGLAGLTDRDIAVLETLREIRPGVFILLAFPAAARERAVKALASGADSYILEPFYLGEFVDLVRRGIERARRPSLAPEAADSEKLAVAVAEVINNRLQILELLLTELKEGATEPEEIRDETDRIKDVAEELLAFARKAEFHPVSVDLNQLLENLASTHPALRGASLGRLAAGLPPIDGDPRGLATLVTAIAGMAAGERIELATGMDEEGRPVLTVWAPDVVLAPDEAQAFFEPFAGPARGATGLAAATAKAVAEAHGAEIDVTSREGAGTAVTVRFRAARS